MEAIEKSKVLDKQSVGADIAVKTQSNDCLMIPKHRFDCVNLCLKETRQALKNKSLELEVSLARTRTLESELLVAKVETALASARAKGSDRGKSSYRFFRFKTGMRRYNTEFGAADT